MLRRSSLMGIDTDHSNIGDDEDNNDGFQDSNKKFSPRRHNRSSRLLLCFLFAIIPLFIIGIFHSSNTLSHQTTTDQISSSSLGGQTKILNSHHSRNNINNISSKSNSNKPFLIIHVGPPKTGTSTLRAAFNELSQDGIFAKDGYEYNTTFVTETVMDFRCHRELLELRSLLQHEQHLGSKNNMNMTITEMTLRSSVPCWNNTLNKLEEYQKLMNGNNGTTQHLFASNETWSFDIHTAGRRITEDNGQQQYMMVDWESIRQTIMPHWNILIVFGYRRYPEWIFSAFNQMNKYKKTKPKLQLWPGKGRGGGGRKIEPIDIPVRRKDMMPISFRYTDDLKREMELHPYIPHAIINMHDYSADGGDGGNGLVSSFLCGILPKAHHSCQYSVNMEKEQSTEMVLNPSSAQSLFYDALAVAAYEAGLINGTLHKRPEVAGIIRDHHHMMTLEKESPFDYFQLNCPTQAQYDGFLNLSLDLERELMPAQFASLPSTQAEHRASFWEQVEMKKFCWIDTESVLNDTAWLEFFDNNFR